MGRGRAKAMQAKIARELKYSSRPLDVEGLTSELSDGSEHEHQLDSRYENYSDRDKAAG